MKQFNNLKDMKKLIIISVFICISLVNYSQDISKSSHVSYVYDDAGNRVSRTTTIILKKTDNKDNKDNKNSTDTENLFGEGNIVIAPNPTAGTLYISFNNIEFAENTVISLYDISGRIVLEQKVKSNREDLYLTNNPAGTYILIIVSGDDKIEYTVIKE